MDCQKIKYELSKELEAGKISDTITLDYLTNLAMRTDDDLELAKEVRRILGVPKSRKWECDYQVKVDNKIYHYLPSDLKL